MVGKFGQGRRLVRGYVLALALIVGVAALFGPGVATVHAQDRITVAVMPFEGVISNQFSQMNVTAQLTNSVTDKLVGSGSFDVVERDRLNQILAEQDLGTAGRLDPAHAVEIGRLLGAQVLIFGTVTRFEMSGSGGISIGGVSLSGTRGNAELTGRIVDATTGTILGSAEGIGSGTGASLSVRNLDGVSFQASEFQNSALGRAVEKAVGDFVDEISKVITANEDRVFAAQARSQLRGTVVAVIDGGVVLNIGEEQGIRREQRLDVFRLMEIPGMDPVRIPVGVVRVISVDPGASVALFENMTSPAEVGDLVAPQ